MSKILKTWNRDKLGSRSARALRAAGRIPAALQGTPQAPHLDLAVDADDFHASRRHHEHLYELEIDGRTETALVRELQWDVLGEELLHIDFRRVDRHQTTEVDVPLEFVGRTKSGVVQHMRETLTVRTRPDDIPDSLTVNVGDLEPGGVVTAAQVAMPAGVELADDPETVVARVSEVRAELETPPEEGAEAAAGTVPAEHGEGSEEEDEEEE